MSEDPGEVVNALVERLDTGAELVGVGSFTLDHAKAWDKLGTYRLADPNTFAVLFVEAAVLLGCEEVDIDQQPQCTVISPGRYQPRARRAPPAARLALCPGA